MSPKLTQIKTSDGLTLPGMIYEIPNSTKAAIYLHGNGTTSVFYSMDKHDALAKALTEKGISYLPFNNRGAHVAKTLKVRKNGTVEKKSFGTAYEIIKESVYDIDGAIAFLQDKGYSEFYLIGESTGANKICVYNHYRSKNPVSKYILLSGSDDTGIYYHMLGKEKFFNLLKEAKEKVDQGDGEELIKNAPELDIYSYQGFYDIANPDGDYNVFPYYEVLHNLKLSKKPLFGYFKAITKPTLVVYGEFDEFAWGNVPKVIDILKQQRQTCAYEIIEGADHSFTGHYDALAKTIGAWLERQ